MYPARFNYEAPHSIDEALDCLQKYGDDARVMAGGQSLIPLMKLRFATPGVIVDLNNIPGLDYHRADADGTLHIGALCRHSMLERSSLLDQTQPTMAACAPLIADPMVRNRGTLVGAVCHGDPQGDWESVMLALGGSVVTRGPNGTRTVPVHELITGPFQNSLAPGEIAVEAIVPPATGIRKGGYLKLERRVGDFATVGVAVALETSGSQVTRAGIGLTAVGATALDASEAAQSLVGKSLDQDTIEEAAYLAAQASSPRSDHRGSAGFKRHIVGMFVERLLTGVA